MSYLKQALLVLMGLLLMTAAAWGQINRGTITGIVTDQSDAVVPGVDITVTNVSTGVKNNVTSNGDGIFTVPNLTPSTYRLDATKTNFKKFSRTSILVEVGETARVDFAMTVGAKTETVEVTSTAPLLKRETSDTGTQITARMVSDLPLTSTGDQRTPATFMQLAPGVTGEGSSDGGAGAGRTMTTSVSGGVVSSTTLSLDGADIPTPSGFEGDLRALQIPPDAIAEFKLQATNGAAEFGRSEGGSASFQMKSGSNQIHGSAYEIVRNDAFNAVPWFANSSDTACSGHACRPPFKQNEFGVTAGGPIKKDKIFAFGYYDGYRLRAGSSGYLQTVPTASMLAGDFSDYGTFDKNNVWHQTPIYDPSLPVGQRANPNGSPICGPIICNNIVNPAAFDRVSKLVVPLAPLPTVTNKAACGGHDCVVNNYNGAVTNPIGVNEWGTKGDYNINEKNRINVLYATGKYATPNVSSIPAPLGGGDQPSTNVTRNVRGNWSFTPRSNMTNQLTLGWDEWRNGQQPLSTYGGKADWTSYLGINGVAPLYNTEFPQIVINGQSWNGGGGAGFSNQHDAQINDSLTLLKGRHTFKFGFQYMKVASNNVSSGRSAGFFNFGNAETSLGRDFTPAGCTTAACVIPTTSTGISAASFLLGYADEAQVQHITAPSYSRVAAYAGFAQDDFKVTKKLTLNLGVRYDLFQPDAQRYNHKSWVDYAVPNAAANNINGTFVTASPSNPYGLNFYKKQISPRIGLAYSLNEKTVIRAAYGIFYAQGNADMLDNGDFVQGYNGSVDITSANNGVTPGFIWGSGSLPGFTPSLAPTTFMGGGTPRHSAGSLISLDRTDSLAPYAQNYTLDVERQLPGQMVLSVAFVGNKGTHTSSRLTAWDKMPPQYLTYGPQTGTTGNSLLNSVISDPLVQATAPISAMPVDPATGNHSPFNGFEALYSGALQGVGTMGQSLRTAPQYQGTHRYFESLGVSDYDALQVKLDKHFSNGLSLLVSYAWSKTLTDGGAMFSTFSSDFATTNPWNRRSQKSYSYMDLPNNLSIAYVYELPVGKGKAFMNHGGVANAILGGWKTSGILRYFSGAPMEIEGNGTSSALEDNGWTQANQVPGVRMRGAASIAGKFHSSSFNPATDTMLNPAAFAQPPQWTFGTLTPNEATVRGFAWPNEDLSLLKDWQLHENWTLNFHADVFNAFNRHVFGENNGAYSEEWTPGQAGFGTVFSTVGNPRQLQFGLDLKW